MKTYVILVSMLFVFFSCASNNTKQKFDLDILSVPKGLPDMEFPIREVKRIITGEKFDLVLVSFKFEKNEKSSFLQAYNHDKKEDKLIPIPTPKTRNMGHRMWHAKVFEEKGGIKIKFNSCMACGDGSLYSLVLRFKNKKWGWSGPIKTEIANEEVEYEY